MKVPKGNSMSLIFKKKLPKWFVKLGKILKHISLVVELSENRSSPYLSQQ